MLKEKANNKCNKCKHDHNGKCNAKKYCGDLSTELADRYPFFEKNEMEKNENN